jgi:dTMP kinase
MKGLFITFEGPDGSGKSTQITRLKEYLTSRGYDVLLVREPGGTRISEQIRNVILSTENKGMNPICEAMLYAASRAQLTHEVIIPALQQGRMVIADRFVDSSIVYQGYARGLGEEMVGTINSYATERLEPDVTFLINIPAEVGIARKSSQKKLDRLEQESISFHKKVHEGYDRLKVKSSRIVEIDGTKNRDEIEREIIDTIRERIKD